MLKKSITDGNQKRFRNGTILLVICAFFTWTISFSSISVGKCQTNEFIAKHQLPILAPMNVLFGLSGNNPSFLSEFEVALKSVLLNAPLERDLFVHILADDEAFGSLEDIFNKTELRTWVTRNPIQIQTYHMTPHHSNLEQLMIDTFKPSFPEFQVSDAIEDHTLGAFYRLYAHRAIPSMVGNILYLDTDVVILVNLEELLQMVEKEATTLFHWGAGMCSCFVVMNASRIDEIWLLAQKSEMKNISETRNQYINDQLIFQSVNITYPDKVNLLPGGWDMTLTDRWQSNHMPYDKVYPNVGFLHLNGEASDLYFDSAWIRDHPDSWGLMKYYIKLPWAWARYYAKSLIDHDSNGHLIQINHSVVVS